MSRTGRLLSSPHALPVTVILLLHAAVLRGVLWGQSVVESGDISAAFLPWQHYGVEAVRAGYLPEWFPYSFCGYPFIANVQAHLFHPTFLLSYLWDPAAALSFSMGLHMIAACLGAYAYFYYRTGDAKAALLGALAFCPGGFFAFRTSVGHTTVIYSLAPLGWACLCLERLLDGRRAWPWLGLALCLSLSLLGGHPQFTLYIGMALAWIVLYRVADGGEDRRALMRGLGWIAAAGAVFLLCVGAQLLPTAELIGLMGDRDPVSVYQYAVKDSVTWLSLLTFLHPDAVGTAAENWSSHSGWHEINVFVGVAALFCALGLLGFLPRRRRWWILGMLAALLVLAMGNQTPIYQYLYHGFPPVRLFRGAARIQCLLQFFLALAAAEGMARLLRECGREDARGKPGRYRLVGALLGAWILILAFIALFPETTRGLLARGIHRTYALHFGADAMDLAPMTANGGAALLSRYESMLSRLAMHLPLALLAAGLLAAAISRNRKLRAAAVVGLILMVGAEDAYLFARSVPLKDREAFMAYYYPRTSTEEYLSAHAGASRILCDDTIYAFFVRKSLESFFPNRMSVYHIYDTRGYDRLVLRRYTQYFNQMQHRAADQYQGMILKLPDLAQVSVPMLDRLNVGYMLSLEPLSHPNLREVFTQPVRQWQVRTYRYRGGLGPAFLCGESSLTAPAEAATEVRAGSVEYGQENPEDLRMTVEAAEACVLVVSQVAYPGWRAWVDGAPAPVEIAYQTFNAVRVPAGRHVVRMAFRSASVQRGLIVSVAGIVLMLAVFAGLRRRESKARA